MGSVWKTVLCFAVILMITAVGMTITAANADVVSAGDYLEGTAAVIRESNYNQQIIHQCQKEAEENGYTLTVQVYENQEHAGYRYAKISFRYPYCLPIFQKNIWKTKERII